MEIKNELNKKQNKQNQIKKECVGATVGGGRGVRGWILILEELGTALSRYI